MPLEEASETGVGVGVCVSGIEANRTKIDEKQNKKTTRNQNLVSPVTVNRGGKQNDLSEDIF